VDEVRALIRRPSRRVSRGITVTELIVSCLILGLLSGMIFLTLQTTRAAEKKLDSVDTIRRAHLMARLHLAEWLRGARMATPNHDTPDASTLVFQKPLVENGQLQVDILGNMIWTEFYTFSISGEGHLLLQSTEGPQLLARLGEGATFAAQALPGKVRVTIISPRADNHEEVKSSLDLYIAGEVSPGGP
jgi:hypothetical protein